MSKIMHAKFGECPEVRRSSPKGGQHPNVRWKWPEVPKPRIIVELGGNRGEDLQAFLTLYPHAHIHSFEPVKSHYDYLLQKFSAPISEGRVKIYNLGASDADAKVTFRTDGDISASSAYGAVQRRKEKPRFEDVQVRDIHKLLQNVVHAERRPIDVFSVNCEGCEYAVLERLRDTGWFSKLKVLQVSWHVSSSIPRRIGRRCRLAKDLPGSHFRLARIADFGWTIFVARPRPYALEESFRGNLTPAQLSHSNGLPQASAGMRCPSRRSAERVDEDPGVTIQSDPDAAHWTYPQTMDQEAALQVFKGRALALPAQGVKPVIFKVGQSWGDTWLGTMAANPSAVIYSFEPVQDLKLLQDFSSSRPRVSLKFGLAAQTRKAQFRVWGTQPSGLDNWNGTLEDVELRDADGVFSEIRRDHGRSADLLYLNCEGCEYEVLQRLADTGWLKKIPRMAIFWHAGGAPWNQRCTLDHRLRESHRLVRAVHSTELWSLRGLGETDPFGQLA